MINLKQGKERELGISLEYNFLNRYSAEVGRKFEDLILDYFTFQDSELGRIYTGDDDDSIFGDLKTESSIISVKYSKSKTWNNLFADNFREGTFQNYFPVLTGRYSLKEVNSFHTQYQNIDYLNDKELIQLVSENPHYFSVLWGENVEVDEYLKKIKLNLNLTTPISSYMMYERMLDVIIKDNKHNFAKQIRGHFTKVFRETQKKTFEMDLEPVQVRHVKKEIISRLNKQHYHNIREMKRDLYKIKEIDINGWMPVINQKYIATQEAFNF